MTEGSPDPYAGTIYNGFSGATGEPRLSPVPVRRRAKGPMIAAGVAIAATLGLGFGLMTREDLSLEPPPPDAPRQATPAPTTVPIEVAAPAPTRVLPAPDKLEVLPDDMAKSAAARAAASAPPRRREVIAEVAAAPVGVPASARAPEPMAAAPPQIRPGFSCRAARTRSEEMVCGDAELAQLDRRLNRAFSRAVASGVPYRVLRQDQDDWMTIREDAARRGGPDGVASVYRQRIAELQQMAGDY